ncbi:hypothetical protein CCO03_12790 [Comamonas serinivorans]|uniref:DUF2486 domain-containing protein n=1 Tax=Comamonas serinivorans TaxID=1082851 RepID=A0A1Y0EPP3_9BURK|nr:hypothetical protein CCO03_12790 [Comamonas serinivorans]
MGPDAVPPAAPPVSGERMPLPESARQLAAATVGPVAGQGKSGAVTSPLEPGVMLRRASGQPEARTAQPGGGRTVPGGVPLTGLAEADLADAVTRLILRSDFQDKLAEAVATVVAQQVHAQLSGQVASLAAKLPELVAQSVQQAISDALRKA